MYIHGEFQDIEGNTVEVHILKGSRAEEYIIGKDGLQFGSDPVVVSVDGSDTFEPIITSTCTITLLTDHYIGDLLFANNARDIKVAVIGSTNFFGYVEPCAFTQPFSNEWEEVQITCLDPLAVLQYITPLTAGETYENLIKNSSVKSFADYIEDMGLHEVLNFVSSSSQQPSIFFDGSVELPNGNGNIIEEIGISESLFLGEDEDSVMNYEEILKEILQYLNLHIRCIHGHFYLYNYDSIRFKNQIQFTNIFNTSNTFPNPVVRHNVEEKDYAGSDTNFSMSEVYNQIAVTCETTPIETVIEDPFDEDDLKPVFPKISHFMREWVSEGKGEEDFNHFISLIHNNFYINEDYSNCWWRDWYCQFFYNNKWTLNNPIYSDIKTKGDDFISRNFEQWELLQRGKVINFMPSFVAFGNSGKQNLQDDSPASELTMNKCLYITVNGDFDNSEEALDFTTGQLQNRTPVATYNSGKAVMLSPIDDTTTNYLVFSGDMVFIPIMQKTGRTHGNGFAPINTTPYEKSNLTFNSIYYLTREQLPEGHEPWQSYIQYKKCRVPYGSESFYQQQFLKEGEWDTSANYEEYCYPFISEYKGEELDYEHSTNPLNNGFDNVKKVPILECMLKVGDKYAVETFDNDGNSIFQWLTIDECPTYIDDYDNTTKVHNTFSLGFNPAVGDKIIGKKWPIATNFDVATNIEATKGTAIPIHASDNITGVLEFQIVGVINATWEQIVKRHATWFRHSTYHNDTKSILHNMHAIQIDGFEAKIYSDNAKLENNGDNDLVYYSSEQTTYLEKKDDITFKINTALTSLESHDLGVKNTVNLSSVVDVETGAFIDKVENTILGKTAKPEELYVESMWNEFNRPKIIINTTLHKSNSAFTRYIFSYLPNRQFIPLSEEISYLYNTTTLTLKEV